MKIEIQLKDGKYFLILKDKYDAPFYTDLFPSGMLDPDWIGTFTKEK